MIFYSAVKVSPSTSEKFIALGSNMSNHHCTLAYSKTMPSGAIHGLMLHATAVVKDIQYWPGADGKGYTVAILECGMFKDWFEYFTTIGCEYDYPEYIPHITLEAGNGDTSSNYNSLIGSVVPFDYQYIKILQR